MAVGTPTIGTKDEQPSASGSSAPGYPSPITAGDCLLDLAVSGQASTSTFNAVTGFTTDAQHSNTIDTLAPNVFGAHRSASGSETGARSSTHGNVVTSTVIANCPGADPTTPLDPNVNSGVPVTIDVSTASSNFTIPSVTVTRDGSLLVYVISGNSTTNTATPPAGWTELIDRDVPTGPVTGTRNWQVAYKKVNAGATGTAVGSWNGSQRATGLLYVIQPPPGATVPGAGMAAGISSTNGAGLTAQVGAGTAAAATSTSGAGQQTSVGAGTAAGASSAAGAAQTLAAGAGLAAAASGTAGAGTAGPAGAGAVAASSSTFGAAGVLTAGAGTAPGVSGSSGAGGGIFGGAGYAAAQSAGIGSGLVRAVGAGFAAAVSALFGAAQKALPLVIFNGYDEAPDTVVTYAEAPDVTYDEYDQPVTYQEVST